MLHLSVYFTTNPEDWISEKEEMFLHLLLGSLWSERKCFRNGLILEAEATGLHVLTRTCSCLTVAKDKQDDIQVTGI